MHMANTAGWFHGVELALMRNAHMTYTFDVRPLYLPIKVGWHAYALLKNRGVALHNTCSFRLNDSVET